MRQWKEDKISQCKQAKKISKKRRIEQTEYRRRNDFMGFRGSYQVWLLR